MKVSLYTDDLRAAPCDLLALGVFSDEPDRGLQFAYLNRLLEGALERACRDERFKGNQGQTVVFNAGSQLASRRVLIYGYGERKDYDAERARRFAGTAVRVSNTVGAKSCVAQLTIPVVPAPAQLILALVQALSEGSMLGGYAFSTYQTKDPKPISLKELRIAFVAEDVQGVKGASIRGAIVRGQAIAEGVLAARSLVNEPPNVLSPPELADRARKMCKTAELSHRVLGVRDLERQGMRLILAVGRGSEHEPRLIHMTYTPEKGTEAKRTVCIVGKGLTFDAGGLSLKPNDSMVDMKADMGGAAAVLGAMEAIAKLKPDVVVHGIIGVAENMPDGRAIRPGDVFVSKKGLTVEVLNTDAEGRLVLADALSYAQDLSPTEIIDLATLTGACMVALGRTIAGAFVSDEGLYGELAQAWERSGEKFWRLPLDPELRELLDSDIADIKNVADRYGGAITAALFLRDFVERSVKWAHLDIAGPVLSVKDVGYLPKGGTGFGVRTLVEFVCGPNVLRI